MRPLQQLHELFRELFQLDLADLDFGIYRLLRLKRDEVDAFLTEQLPRRVRETFAGMALEEKAALELSVAERSDRIRAAVSEEAILPDGEIAAELRDLERLSEAPAFAEQGIRIGGWLLTHTALEHIPDGNGRGWNELERQYPLLHQDADGKYVWRVLNAP